jgi:integrase
VARRSPGSLVVVDRRREGPVYYGKWRLHDGTQVKRRLGQAWLEHNRSGGWRRRRGRPAEGFLTEKDAIVEMARVRREHEETIGRAHRPDRTFADVAEDWLRHGERKRGLKRSTLRDYRQVLDAYLLPAFGEVPVASVTSEAIERWHSEFRRSRTAEKVLMVLRAILGYAARRGWIADNAAQSVERHPVRYSGDYDLYSRDEVEALVRAAASEQDAAIFATAAMSGLRRGELIALRWRDVDFAGQAIRVRGNYSYGGVVTPKSGKVRVVPMVLEVAQHLARLGQRERFVGDDDPVFCNDVGGHIDGSALRRRYQAACKRAGLRPLPFHSLRHHFGSVAVNRASLVQVQAWMGHSHIQTTARYLHHRSQASDAALLAEAFASQAVTVDAPRAQSSSSAR